MNLISETLRKKRMEKGLQAKDMAYALKIKPSTYSRIENGITKITIELAKKISEILQIPLNEFIDTAGSKYEIKNGDNSPFAIENSNLTLHNEKLLESVFKLVDQIVKISEQQNKIAEQQILLMQNQNEIFKEFIKSKKSN